jgi:glycosidase
MYGTPFAQIPSIEDIVMYEVNLRAYSQQGNLQGVIDRLDSIKLLGVNVLWLMPLHPVGVLRGINSPYCVRDYKEVGSEYGNLDDLRRLTDAAHARGMAVLLDWVANHTSWDHAWMQQVGWHTRNSQGVVVHPPGTNWTDVADLNYQNTAMREAMEDAILYWIYQANVDGFRCDHADGVPFDFWQSIWSKVRSIPGRRFVLFAEGSRQDHFAADFDLNFSWTTYQALKQVWQGQSPWVYLNARTTQNAQSPAGKYWLQFTTNHDESAWDATPATLFGGLSGAFAASALSLCGGGPQLLYGSQEVGVAANIPFFSRSLIPWNSNRGLLVAYRQLMTTYREHPALRKGMITPYTDPNLACLSKTLGSDTVLCAVNTRNQVHSWTVPPSLQGSTWETALHVRSGLLEPRSTLELGSSLTLQPYEVYFLTLP